MTDIEKDILARFTALDSIVAFLLARHLRSLPADESKAVASTFMGTDHRLKLGLMDVETLQDIAGRIEASLAHIVSHAQEMDAHWRLQGGE